MCFFLCLLVGIFLITIHSCLHFLFDIRDYAMNHLCSFFFNQNERIANLTIKYDINLNVKKLNFLLKTNANLILVIPLLLS